MEAKDRIIVALDVDSLEKAKVLVEQLAPYVSCFKAGLELLTSEGTPKVVNAIHEWGGQVFYDGKFNDIPNTVAAAARAVTRMGVMMFNIHCLSGSEAMRKTRETVDKTSEEIELVFANVKPLILGVTILTSLDYKNLVEMGIFEELGYADPQELADAQRQRMENLIACYLAWLAQECGLDGVISSPKEIKAIRRYCQPEFKIVTPGIRPAWSEKGDQKRVMTPAEAIKEGADYLVIGRPIIKPPAEIGTPIDAVRKIAEEIASVL